VARSRTRSRLIAAGLVALALGGCVEGRLAPSATITTANPAWEHWFNLKWDVEPGKNDTRRISGYIYSTHGSRAVDVQILAQALDASGAVVAQQIRPGPQIPGVSRAYFEMWGLPPADHYRVTIWAFAIVEDPGRD
jgi:hypothetical protein